ncbi:hypothetical protein FBU30_005719 [Linnemannia zychae]|nr:hypothetical protein FBU30_005719 [Linnemannia zychae]
MSKQFINHTSIVAHARNSLSGTADSDTNRENDGDDNDNEELDSWACYDQLTTLCCQIGLVDRLNNDDQALYDKISVPGYTARLPRKRHLAVTLHYERLVSQEIKIYTALARLTALRVLDIGYRAIQLSPFKFQHIKGTLQLKLESGLGLLGALAQLEEFGFEGVDHRMEEAEIEWMAQAWPRLKVMYGLEADNPEWSHPPYVWPKFIISSAIASNKDSLKDTAN